MMQSSPSHDLESLLSTITPWLKEAGQLLTEPKAQLDVEHKSHDELVTATDLAVDRLLTNYLEGSFPDHRIMSEESNTSLPDFDGYVWVVDPIDGTVNYATGVPFSAISIALCHNGKAVLGVVYNPTLEQFYSAIAGRGAYCNGKPIGAAYPRRQGFASPVIATGFPYDAAKRQLALHQAKLILDSFGYIRRLGSAALDLCLVADGTYSGYYEVDLSPWDMAAGGLIVKEAGHQLTSLSPQEGLPEDLQCKHVVAGSTAAFDTLCTILRPALSA